ncbi:MAG: hypothetical protein IIC71_05330 [Acidobacteria bacterium]|nr:hypothetical protein [Acidobacteriota bacterium]
MGAELRNPRRWVSSKGWSFLVLGAAVVAVVALSLSLLPSGAAETIVQDCDLADFVENDLSEASGRLPSGELVRVLTIAAASETDAISVRKAVFSECADSGASIVSDGVLTMSWRTACGSGLLMRSGEDSIVVIVEAPTC